MVRVIERLIQEIYPNKFEELEEIDKRFTEIENKCGFPPKKRIRCIAGPHDINTVILEREWSSLSKFEKAATRLYLDPEIDKLSKELFDIVKGSRSELYIPHFVTPADAVKE